MYELADLSRSRGGATVLWIVIHTAEGPTDAYPTDPDRDSGSADSLTAFALRMGDRSWHACADDDVLRDQLVPYDRAAWTLRNGSEESDNLEMCGLASWTREQWLQHRGMLARAARWVAGRCRARGIAPVRLSDAQVAGRQAAGYLDHGTYTRASGDGTHWDVGPGFPWDVFASLVDAAYAGDPIPELEDDMPTISEIKTAMREVLNEGTAAGQASWAATSRATLGAVQGVVNLVNSSTGALAARITDARTAILTAVAAQPGTVELDDAARAALAADIAALVAEHGVTVDVEALGEALAVDLSGRLAA